MSPLGGGLFSFSLKIGPLLDDKVKIVSVMLHQNLCSCLSKLSINNKINSV